MNERLTPDERIRKKSDFAGLYRLGSRFRGRLFTLVFLRNELGHARLAVVASRKVGSASSGTGSRGVSGSFSGGRRGS